MTTSREIRNAVRLGLRLRPRSARRSATAKFAAALAEIPSMTALLDPWAGAHGGYPRFDLINTAHFPAALMNAMVLKREEVNAIAGQTAAPTFENTIAALDDTGRTLTGTEQLFGIYISTMKDKPMQAIEAQMMPVLAAFESEIVQNDALFQRIKAVYESCETAPLTDEQKRLTGEYYRLFVRFGAGLDTKKKARLSEINQKLAELFTTFSSNLLADEEEKFLVLESEDELAGLSDSFRAAAARVAEERGMTGKWLIKNTRSSMDQFITDSARRPLREKAWRMFTGRGDNNDAHDNKATISQILMLRTERAQLLGKATFAHWAVENRMAKTPEAALELMMTVWEAAIKRVKEEVADMQAIADKEEPGLIIEPWDYLHYAEKVRKAKYDIDQAQVKQYLQLDKMVEAVFWAAHQAHGLEMTKIEGLPVVHPDVTVYEVRRAGQFVGLCYCDLYARDGKRSGAWMEGHRVQEKFHGKVTAIVSINANFMKGKADEPALLSWDDARTLFHEFGHALHGLLSDVNYPTLSGTRIDRDAVEFPSQLNEYWLSTEAVLRKFALHYKTGEAMPAELIEKIRRSKTFNQGFATTEYLASGIYDMRIHLAATADKPIDPAEFERNLMAEIGCPKEIVMRHRPTQFGHIFGDDGYAAGYYSYIYAETLVADAAEAFEAAGSFYDPCTCKRLDDQFLRVGNSVPADVAYRHFRGRDVDPQALMRARGLSA